MSRWKCNNKDCYCGCVIDMNSPYVPSVCSAFNEHKKADWHPVDELTTNCNQLPKLTAEVFNRPECPEWAQWAAVDESGMAFYYYEKPYERKHTFHSWDRTKSIDDKFDASDWKNSLIERLEKKETLPDWCKVGEWVWSDGKYHKIIETGQDWIRTAWDDHTGIWGNILHQFSQARLRPYNAEEMKALVGKVLSQKSYDFRGLIHYASASGNKIDVSNFTYSSEELIGSDYTIDGKPCGVLEHLENGEWLE